jgi:hypothetical protein
MRSTKELEAMVVSAIAVSGGQARVDLLAIDDAEADWFRDRLHGRHGVKTLGVVRGVPADAIPIIDRVRDGLAGRLVVSKSTTINTEPPAAPVLTEDGY